MARSGLEELFDRFRRDGDLDALAEVFDRTAEKLLKVARHLSQDEAQAEDVVQATFLAAIEGREGFDASRELVPWLTGILTHKAKVARALSLRAPDPERLSTQAFEDPAVIAELSDLHTTLDRALERVPEGYREVLRLHLRQGLEAEEIARELARPAGTVRVQLHRGLKHLRRGLPAGIALAGFGVVVGSRGLAAIRAEILGHATSVAAATGGSAVAGATVGGLMMGKKIALVVAIALVALGGGWIAARNSLRSTGDPSSRATTSERLEVEGDRSQLTSGSETAARSMPMDAASIGENDPYGALDLAWTWADGTPAAGLDVLVIPMGESQPYEHLAFAYANEEGRLGFERLHEGEVRILTERCGNSTSFKSSVTRARRTSASFQVPAGHDIDGRVLDPDGNPRADGTVWLTTAPDAGGNIVARSRADGRFTVRSLGVACFLFATAPPFGASAVERVGESNPSSSTDVDLKLRGPAGSVEGVVRGSKGAPVENAWVTVRCEPTFTLQENFEWPALWTATSTDGTFRFDAVRSGKIAVEVTHAGYADWMVKSTVDEGETKRLDVRLEQGFVLEGTVHAADGAPVAGATLLHRALPAPTAEGWRYQQSTKTDEKGNFRLRAVPPGPTQFQVEGKLSNAMGRATTELTGTSGETIPWNPVLSETATISGRVVDETGNGLEQWSVGAWTGARVDYHPKMERTNAEGRFELLNGPPVPFVLPAYPPRDGAMRIGVSMENVVPGGGEVTIVVTSSNRPSAFVRGKVVDAEGKPLANAWVNATDWESRQNCSSAVHPEDGSFQVGPLAPVAQSIDVVLRGKNTVNLEPVELAPDEERDLGTITVPAPGQFELVIRREDGAKVESPWISLVHGRIHHFLNSKDGVTFRAGNLYPGKYVLFPIGKNIATETRAVEIRSGETAKLELVVHAGVVQDFDFRPPAGEKGPSEMNVVIRRSDGTVLLEMTTGMNQAADGTRTPSFDACFGPGRYSYEATAKGWRSAGEFEITDTSADPPTIHAGILRTP